MRTAETDLLIGRLALDRRLVTYRRFVLCSKAVTAVTKGAPPRFAKVLAELGQAPQAELDKLEAQVAALGEGEPCGKYRLLLKLGENTHGVRFLAWDPEAERLVAVQVLARHLLDNANYVVRLGKQLKLAQGAQHPNLVRTGGLEQAAGEHLFAMEYVHGVSMARLLDEERVLPEKEAIEHAVAIAEALHAAHRTGALHGDVQPARLLLDSTGVAKLGDLGFVKVIGPASPSKAGSAELLGAPAYMSPEHFSSSRKLTSRSDEFSLGAVLFHMATGRPPYSGSTVFEIAAKIARDETPDPRQINPNLSPSFGAAIQRMMAKNPAARFKGCDAVAQALKLMPCMTRAKQSPLAVKPPEMADLAVTDDKAAWFRSKRRIAALTIGLCVLSLIALLVLRTRRAADGVETAAPPRSRLVADGFTFAGDMAYRASGLRDGFVAGKPTVDVWVDAWNLGGEAAKLAPENFALVVAPTVVLKPVPPRRPYHLKAGPLPPERSGGGFLAFDAAQVSAGARTGAVLRLEGGPELPLGGARPPTPPPPVGEAATSQSPAPKEAVNAQQVP